MDRLANHKISENEYNKYSRKNKGPFVEKTLYVGILRKVQFGPTLSVRKRKIRLLTFDTYTATSDN